jgi:hypothetical protein
LANIFVGLIFKLYNIVKRRIKVKIQGPELSGATVAPTLKVRASAILLLDLKIKWYSSEVAYNGVNFVPSYIKIGQMGRKLE